MRKMAYVMALLLVVALCGGVFAQDKKDAAKPAAAAPAATPQAPRVVVPPPGQWVGFDQGQYTIVAAANGGSSIVVVFSTWDPILSIPGVTYSWAKDIQQKEVDRTTKAYKLSAAIAMIPGVVDVAITKHRVEVQRAFVYSWDSILPQLLEVFKKSDLVKQGG